MSITGVAQFDAAAYKRGTREQWQSAAAAWHTFAAARRAGPAGAILATDISPAILEYAAGQARRLGLGNVATREMDGEHLDVQPGSFDAVISRVGLIYFPDQEAALAGML